MTESNKIVLLGDEEDVSNPEFSFIQPPFPKPPCRLILIGSSNCGKTNTVLNLLTRFWIYPNSDQSIFDEIFIMTPTALSDPKLRILAKHPDLRNKVFLTDKLEIDLIDELLARNPTNFEDGKLPNTLVFIDDFTADKRNSMNPSIVNLFFRGRHENISVIINSQYYFNIPPNVRTNASGIMIFRLKRNAELALIRNELSTPKIHDETFDEILHRAQEGENWNFLFIDNMTQKFYRNFSKEYDIESPSVTTIPEEKKELPIPEGNGEGDDIDQEIKRQMK
jgi:hypothetical protein